MAICVRLSILETHKSFWLFAISIKAVVCSLRFMIPRPRKWLAPQPEQARGVEHSTNRQLNGRLATVYGLVTFRDHPKIEYECGSDEVCVCGVTLRFKSLPA